jgi:hypothetical protein
MELKYWGILKFYEKIKPLPFAHHANGSLSLVRLLVKKETEVLTFNLLIYGISYILGICGQFSSCKISWAAHILQSPI